MKRIYIVGTGMSRETVTIEGLKAIKSADILFGASRMLDEFSELGIPSTCEYRATEIAKIIASSSAKTYAVLVSGDTGFYSATNNLIKAFKDDYEVHILPGISSLIYFYSRLGLPWENAVHISCHGRICNISDYVRRNHHTFLITGGNLEDISNQLVSSGFEDITIMYGENLGMETERIGSTNASSLPYETLGNLTVLLIINPASDASTPTGLPDASFVRGDVPMTKSEVRAVIMSKLAISPDDTFIDIGAGTGSVTVEAALSAWRGTVYAIEKNHDGASLIAQNCKNFHIGNVQIITGIAPDCLDNIPSPDVAFIGGSSGNLLDIVSRLVQMNPKIRIVISAIAIESVSMAIAALEHAHIEPEVIQISSSHAKKAGKLHMMLAQNPIYIVSGGICHE